MMLEEVLQGGKSAIKDFLRQVPDATGQSMADNFQGYFGHIDSFAEMGNDSLIRSKRICESSLASLYDTDLSRLEFDPEARISDDAIPSHEKMPTVENPKKSQLLFGRTDNQRSGSQREQESYRKEISRMKEKNEAHRTLCRHLFVAKGQEHGDGTHENLVRMKAANDAVGNLLECISQIATLLEFSGRVCQIHSRVTTSIHTLEQYLGSVFRKVGNEISVPEELAIAACKFNSHMSEVTRVMEGLSELIDKTAKLRSLAADEKAGINDFYNQKGNLKSSKLVAKSNVAKGYKKHNEAIVDKIHGYSQKAQGRLADISVAVAAWKYVQDAIHKRNLTIQSAHSDFHSAPCKMPSIVYEAISGNDYSLKARDLGELQKAIDDSLQSVLGRLAQQICLMREVQPKLDCFEERHVNKTVVFPSYILLNETRYVGGDNSWLKVDVTIPRVHSFPFENPLSIPAKEIAQVLLLRLATTLPLGCCDITILDHETQGDSVLGIAPMKGVPGLMNLVVLRDRVADALRGLYEYSGKLIEDGYFTVEAPDWKSYNAKHPDAPLPYKVLVIFSLVGLERVTDGMSMLQSLMKNGCRRGIQIIFTGAAHEQVCGDDPKFASDRKNRFSEVVIDVIQA